MAQRIDPKVGIVIVAGGSGSRFGGSTPKQFRFLGQLPMLAHTINSFAGALPNAELVVVLSADRVEYWRNLAMRFEVAPHKIVEGGEQRYHSVKSGISALSDEVEIIGVHDGARPLCTKDLISRAIEGALSNGSAIPAVALSDSLREVDPETGSSRSVDRSHFKAVQTPQCFDAIILRRAYQQPYDGGFTDDASVVERMGEPIWLCEGEFGNIKITTAEDMVVAEIILNRRSEGGE